MLPTNTIHWAPTATDPSKLRSLLLNPAAHPHVRLYEHCNSSYALTQEQLGDSIRCTVYGNLGHQQQPDYEHAMQQIVARQPPVCKFSALPDTAVPAARAVFASSGYRETHNNPCWQYVLQGPLLHQLQAHASQLTQQLPGFEISTLQEEDAALVDRLWTFRSPGSAAIVAQLISGSHTSCVRNAAGDPVAWALEVEPGCAGMLHTLQGYRRNSLARLVMLDLLQKLQHQHQHQQQEEKLLHASTISGVHSHRNGDTLINGGAAAAAVAIAGPGIEGWPGGHVYCYVVQDNDASVALMESLGLTRTGEFVWMGFERAAAASN